MDNSHKKEFWLMVNVAMELTNHPPLTKEAIVTWWHLLSKYEFADVQNSVDNWCKTMSKPPTPNDIISGCQHKVTIHARLPSPLAIQDNKRHIDELKEHIAENLKPKTDYKAWAKRILANPKQFPDISVKFAKEALNVN